LVLGQAGTPVLLPDKFALSEPYPNPFNSRTCISYALPEGTQMRLAAFDLTGRRTAVIFEGVKAAGYYEAIWEAEIMPVGIYLVRLTTATGYEAVQKAVIIK